MNDDQNGQVDQNDPETSLDDLNPVPLKEANGDGPEPSEAWGNDGEGNDAEANDPQVGDGD